MTPPNFPPQPRRARRRRRGALAGGALASVGTQALAATAAGQQIKNLATVTYQDAAGNTYTAESNEAIVTVAQVYSATIGVDNDKPAAPGETVYLPYRLTNTGNGTDLFDVAAVDGATGTNLASTSLVIYADGKRQRRWQRQRRQRRAGAEHAEPRGRGLPGRRRRPAGAGHGDRRPDRRRHADGACAERHRRVRRDERRRPVAEQRPRHHRRHRRVAGDDHQRRPCSIW